MDTSPPVPADVLVVGAGLAGATAARESADAGFRVLVLDKGRGPGGRLSTRRVDGGGFDHGAVCLQAHGKDFLAWIGAQVAAGHAAPWGEGWVGVPGMDALVAGLLEGIDVRWSTTVVALSRVAGQWQAIDAKGLPFARSPRLVLAVPAPQARALLMAPRATAGWDAEVSALVAALQEVRYAPCWAGLAVVEGAEDHAPALIPEAAALAALGLSAVVREGAKPARCDAGHWVVHADTGWSTLHLEQTAEDVARWLRTAFVAATGIDDRRIRSFGAHRWRYARPLTGLDPVLAVAVDGLALAGDAIGWRVEEGIPPAERAWRSGRGAVAHLREARPLQLKS